MEQPAASAKMKLYCSLTSPYARRVRVVIEELGLADQVEEIVVDPFSPPPEMLVANPLSRIPTLISERGEALPDSRLIIEYLQARGRPLSALPRGSQRWAALRRLQLAEGIMDAAVATVLEKRRPEGIIYTAHLDRQSQRIKRAVEALNTEASTLSLRSVSLVEITAGVALGYLDFRMPYLEWHRGHQGLAQWFESFAHRPSMKKTQPPAA
jgi:glutathione S-transferase